MPRKWLGCFSIEDLLITINSYDEDGSPYWEHDPLSSFAQQEFPLPPADVFRAALNPSDAKGKPSKEKGKSSNPFQG